MRVVRTRRVGGAVGGLVGLLMLLSAPTALACNEPRMSIFAPPEVRAGDTIHFDITDADAGAEFTIKANGRLVHSGTKTTDTQGYRGSFQVPDLGDVDQDVSFDGYVYHPDDGASSNPSSAQTRYRAPQPPPAPPEPTSSEPVARQSPADTVSEGRQPTRPDRSLGGGRPRVGDSPSEPVATRPRAQGRPLGGGRPRAGDSPSEPVATRPRAQGRPQADTPSAEASRPRGVADRARSSEPRMSRVTRATEEPRSGAVPRPTRVAAPPKPASLARPPATWTSWPVEAWESAPRAGDGGGESPPAVLVAVAALVLVAGVVGGGGALVRWRRDGPQPEPVAPAAMSAEQESAEFDDSGVEAALQELIAEERARRLVTARDQPERTT